MTDADKIMNTKHFRRDLVDIWILISLTILTGIPDHFCLKCCCWRFVLSKHGLVTTVDGQICWSSKSAVQVVWICM